MSIEPKVSGTFNRTALIIKFGQIGDVIMVLPAVHALHQQGYAITWVCGAAASSLLKSIPWIQTITVDDRAILRGGLKDRIFHILRLWKRIATKRYDLCATLYFDKRFRLLALPVVASRKLQLSWRTRERMLVPGRHHPDEYARILLGLKDDHRETHVSPFSFEPNSLLPDFLPRKGRRRIALVPGGASNVMGQQTLRRWPIENYVQLASALLQQGREVVLIGGPDDLWVSKHFGELAVENTIGNHALDHVLAVMNACDVVVSHDTGPMHLAGMSKARVLAIFGPTSPFVFLPRKPGSTGIWGGEGFACRPCYDGRNFAPCSLNTCMHQVKPEMILRQLDVMLDSEWSMKQSWRILQPGET